MKIKNEQNHSLTKESLLKLLEDKPSDAADLDELDDFEKEALEGFNLNTTPKNAAKFIEEVNSSISNNVMNSASGSKKRGLVWFSIAASITFIIGLSLLLLQQQSVQTEQQVALNEAAKVDSKTDNSQSDPSLESIEFKNDKATSIIDEIEKPTTTGTYKQAPAIISRANDLKPDRTIESDDDNQKSKDKSLESFAYDNNTNNTMVDSKNDAAKMNEREESTPMAGVASTKKSSSSNGSIMPSTSSVKQKATSEAKQVNAEVITATSADYESLKKEEVGANSNKVTTTTAAYYKGGTKSIKKFIVNYEKSKPFNQPLQGDFLIKGIVKTNGTFLVSHIVSKNEVFIEYLTSALGTLKDWVPAKNGTLMIESAIEFKLHF